MTGSSTAAVPTPCAPARINAAFVEAFLAQDASAIARHYMPQGRLLLSHVELVTGRMAIQAFWQGVLDMGIYCAERISVEWQNGATLANEIGTYVLRNSEEQVVDQGTYVALWQWWDNRWQIGYEVWRSHALTHSPHK